MSEQIEEQPAAEQPTEDQPAEVKPVEKKPAVKRVPVVNPVALIVAHNVRALRNQRRWSAQEVTDRTEELGRPIARSILTNLENMRREDVTVDELAIFAQVFTVDPWSLCQPDGVTCVKCSNDPPPGFQCIVCGRLKGFAE